MAKGRPIVDISGQVFAKRTVLSFSHIQGNEAYWLCRCECGHEDAVRGTHVRAGVGCKSCRGKRHRTHGQSRRSPTYNAWTGAKARCFNPNNPNFRYWGARGIRMCDRWRYSFEAFLEDMGERPDGMTLGRIDNDGDYEPANCRWETRTQQMRNTRRNHFIVYNGTRACLKQWAEMLGIPYSHIFKRAQRRQISYEEAVAQLAARHLQ